MNSAEFRCKQSLHSHYDSAHSGPYRAIPRARQCTTRWQPVSSPPPHLRYMLVRGLRTPRPPWARPFWPKARPSTLALSKESNCPTPVRCAAGSGTACGVPMVRSAPYNCKATRLPALACTADLLPALPHQSAACPTTTPVVFHRGVNLSPLWPCLAGRHRGRCARRAAQGWRPAAHPQPGARRAGGHPRGGRGAHVRPQQAAHLRGRGQALSMRAAHGVRSFCGLGGMEAGRA